MQPYVLVRRAELEAEQLPDADEPVHFTEGLAEAVLQAYSARGDRVLDPFAGFGTTLAVAERLGRTAVGVELLAERVDLVRRRAPGTHVVQGDARRLGDLVEGPFDLAFTSPPYRTRNDHPEDPLQAYASEGGSYQTYLAELGDVFAQVAGLLRPNGHLVVNVANLLHEGVVTTLAWDLAGVVGQWMTFCQEVFVCWDRPATDVTGDYCLVFQPHYP